MTLSGLKYYLSDPSRWIDFAARLGLLKWISDEKYIRAKYRQAFGKEPDLNDPKTFSEKLQWLKLYDRKPLYTQLVDKYEVRKYVAGKIGEDHLIPLVGGPWNSVDEIDFEALPEQFVLKCTHDSGGLIICRDRSTLNIDAAKAKLRRSLKRNYYWMSREWPYKDVQPRIIAEKFMTDSSSGELRDYKFLAFNGEVKAMFVVSGRGSAAGTRMDYFDADYNPLQLTNGYPNSERLPEKPACFNEMKTLAAKLSQSMPQARVDLYEVNEKVYFGEITFFDSSGLEPFDPPEWDELFGSWITLPEKQ